MSFIDFIFGTGGIFIGISAFFLLILIAGSGGGGSGSSRR